MNKRFIWIASILIGLSFILSITAVDITDVRADITNLYCGGSSRDGDIIYKFAGEWICTQLGNATKFHNITTINTYTNGTLTVNGDLNMTNHDITDVDLLVVEGNIQLGSYADPDRIDINSGNGVNRGYIASANGLDIIPGASKHLFMCGAHPCLTTYSIEFDFDTNYMKLHNINFQTDNYMFDTDNSYGITYGGLMPGINFVRNPSEYPVFSYNERGIETYFGHNITSNTAFCLGNQTDGTKKCITNWAITNESGRAETPKGQDMYIDGNVIIAGTLNMTDGIIEDVDNIEFHNTDHIIDSGASTLDIHGDIHYQDTGLMENTNKFYLDDTNAWTLAPSSGHWKAESTEQLTLKAPTFNLFGENRFYAYTNDFRVGNQNASPVRWQFDSAGSDGYLEWNSYLDVFNFSANAVYFNDSIDVNRNITAEGVAIDGDLTFTESPGTLIKFVGGLTQSINFYVDAILMFQFAGGFDPTRYIYFNPSSENVDTVIYGESDTPLFQSDASAYRIGIGDGSPSSLLDVAGDISTTGTLNVSNDCGVAGGVFFAEENAALDDGLYEWAFGNGANNDEGITQACDGRITAISLSCNTAGTRTNVTIVVNKNEATCNITLTGNHGYATCDAPFSAGDYTVPRTTNAGGCSLGTVAFWVRYD